MTIYPMTNENRITNDEVPGRTGTAATRDCRAVECHSDFGFRHSFVLAYFVTGHFHRLLFILAVVSFTSAATAAQPNIALINPPGLQRSAEAAMVIHGDRLQDAQSLLFYGPGLEVRQLAAAEDGKSVNLTIAAAGDCPIGLHYVRLRTATGISNLWTMAVGALPETTEVEPNGDFSAPQTVACEITVRGVITQEDVDYFVVEAKQGERLTAELEGMRLGITFFDPYVAILDESRFELARSDDAALLRQDPVCSIQAPADGRYIVEVRDSSFQGNDRCHYRLHVGKFLRPLAAVPAGGKPGESLEVTWLGDVLGPGKTSVRLPPDDQIARLARRRAPLLPQDEQGLAPSPLQFRVVDLPNHLESEPNDARDTANACTVPAALNGVVGSAGDVDWFRFSAKKDDRYNVQVYARNILRSPLDSVLRIRDASGKVVIGNDDTAGPDSYVRFVAPADGEYLVEIHDHLRSGGPTHAYRVELAPVQPRLVMRLPERQRYFSTTLIVPQGNRTAVMLAARRSDWDGAVACEFQGLPAGVTAQVPAIPDGRGEVPVLLTAAVDAPLAGSLVDIVGRAADETIAVSGHLQQRTMLVRGQNNRDTWGHDSDRAAAVVTQRVPFQIEIAQPKAPLVRNGSMQLNVVATRDEGFTAPIQVRMLYNPPGVASTGTVTMAENQNEVSLPLTANGSAELAVWQIVVIGKAPGAGGGVAEVASQLANLEVADHFFELAFSKVAVEQGSSVDLPVQITHKRPGDGPVQVEVVGLPAGATCGPVEFTAETQQLMLPIQTAADARVGQHRTIYCRAVATLNGEPVVHTLGTAELRIDKPRPAQAEVASKPPEQKKPEAPKALSRLEQLRRDRESAKGQ